MTPERLTIRRTEGCRWSVPACRPKLLSDRDDDFEVVWLCVRAGNAVAVTPDDCSSCVHYSPERDHAAATGRRR